MKVWKANRAIVVAGANMGVPLLPGGAPAPGGAVAVAVAVAGGGYKCGFTVITAGAVIITVGTILSLEANKYGPTIIETDEAYILNSDIINDTNGYADENVTIKLDVRLKKSHDGSSKIPDKFYKVQVDGDVYNVSFKDSVGTFNHTIKKVSTEVVVVFENQYWKQDGDNNNTFHMLTADDKPIEVNWGLNPTNTRIGVPSNIWMGEEFRIRINTLKHNGDPIRDGNYKITIKSVWTGSEEVEEEIRNIDFVGGVAEIPYKLNRYGQLTLAVRFETTPIYYESSDYKLRVVIPRYGNFFVY